MTAAARITQDDMNRVAKSVRNAGFHNARIIFRLDKQEIEVIVGESGAANASPINPFDEAED